MLPRLSIDRDRQLAPLERVFVDPLDGVRRTVVVGLEQRAVDVETDGPEHAAGGGLDLRDNPDRSRAAGSTEW